MDQVNTKQRQERLENELYEKYNAGGMIAMRLKSNASTKKYKEWVTESTKLNQLDKKVVDNYKTLTESKDKLKKMKVKTLPQRTVVKGLNAVSKFLSNTEKTAKKAEKSVKNTAKKAEKSVKKAKKSIKNAFKKKEPKVTYSSTSSFKGYGR